MHVSDKSGSEQWFFDQQLELIPYVTLRPTSTANLDLFSRIPNSFVYASVEEMLSSGSSKCFCFNVFKNETLREQSRTKIDSA